MPSIIKVDQIQSDTGNIILSGNVSLPSSNLNIDNGALFVNQINNRVGVGGIINPSSFLDVNTSLYITENGVASSNTDFVMFSRFSDNQRGYVYLKAESNSSGSSDLVIRSRNNFLEAEKFRIDSAGRITAPNQPAFAAALTRSSSSTWTNFTNGTTIIFDDATTNDLFNNGGHYSTTTGRFTAPVNGVYVFSFSANISGGTNWRNVQLRINGTVRRQNYNQNDTSWDLHSFAHIVQLSAGDYVTCTTSTDGGALTLDANPFGSTEQWTFFNGYLLG